MTPEDKAEVYSFERIREGAVYDDLSDTLEKAYLAGYAAGLEADKNMAYAEGWNDGVEEAIDRAAQPQWISVKDRLPEQGQEVLVMDRGLVDISAQFTSGFGTSWVGDSDNDVTHWMPLPEPPKEGE